MKPITQIATLNSVRIKIGGNIMYLLTLLIIVVTTIQCPSVLQEILIGISVRYLTSIHSLAPTCKAYMRVNTSSSKTSGYFPKKRLANFHGRVTQDCERTLYKVGALPQWVRDGFHRGGGAVANEQDCFHKVWWGFSDVRDSFHGV